MKRNKIGAVLMATAMAATLGLSACNGGGTVVAGDPVQISIINFGGGVGEQWLLEAGARFEKLNENTDYGNGYVGVEITDNVLSQQGISTATMPTDAYNLYFLEGGSSVSSLAQQNFLLDITDVVTTPLTEYGEDVTIESKISENYRIMEKGNDGNYYGVPHYEFYPGVSYDIDMFASNNLYFADSGADNYTSKFGSARFIASATEKKSCGPDGVYDTVDDGLPTSLLELLILCSKMSSATIKPFGLSGKIHQYSNHLVAGLWASLAGYEQMQTCYTFNGTIDAVVGYSEENLFPGVDYIKKPIVEKVTVTPETGYRIWDMAARYYATALLEIIDTEGWFSTTAFRGSSHTEEQKYFIFSGTRLNGVEMEKIGMLIEGNYWYNESVNSGNFEDYYAITATSERNIGWMSLPINVDTTVTEGNGKSAVLIETALSNAFINGNIKDDESLVKACKSFLRYLYTDEELAAFTACTGVAKAVNYELGDKEAELDSFQKTVWKAKTNNVVLYAGADNQTFRNSVGTFKLNAAATVFKYGSDKNYLDPIHNRNITTKEIFEASKFTQAQWNTVYRGNE